MPSEIEEKMGINEIGEICGKIEVKRNFRVEKKHEGQYLKKMKIPIFISSDFMILVLIYKINF